MFRDDNNDEGGLAVFSYKGYSAKLECYLSLHTRSVSESRRAQSLCVDYLHVLRHRRRSRLHWCSREFSTSLEIRIQRDSPLQVGTTTLLYHSPRFVPGGMESHQKEVTRFPEPLNADRGLHRPRFVRAGYPIPPLQISRCPAIPVSEANPESL